MIRPVQDLQSLIRPVSAGSPRFPAQPECCAGRPLPVEAWQDAQLRCRQYQICKGWAAQWLLSCRLHQQQQQTDSLHPSSTQTHLNPPQTLLQMSPLPAERQHRHAPGALADMISNLVKNWEKEASYKIDARDWRTIDHRCYQCVLLPSA